MLEFKNVIPNIKESGFVREVLDGHKAEIEALLADASKHIGEGRTASVCFLDRNDKVCLKIFKRPEQITGVDFYLPPSKEKVFLEKLDGLKARAKVPKAYACYEDGGQSLDFLMMEKLSAVSVDDVLQGREKLLEKFDLASFRKDLLDFVEMMHQENIYHRDLHEGNIMIDRNTCQVYVIDFGAATEFYGEPEPGEKGPYHITKDGQDIILTSDESMVKTIVKKLGNYLTSLN